MQGEIWEERKKRDDEWDFDLFVKIHKNELLFEWMQRVVVEISQAIPSLLISRYYVYRKYAKSKHS